MDQQVVGVDPASIPSEGGSESIVFEPVTARLFTEGVWQQSAAKDGWFKIVNGVPLVVTNQELKSWEVVQRTPDGKDALRGIKLKARLDGVITSRIPEAVSDATGTP